MKKQYQKPALLSVPIKLGVFGDYGSSPGGGDDGGGHCHHGNRLGWGWGWWGGWW